MKNVIGLVLILVSCSLAKDLNPDDYPTAYLVTSSGRVPNVNAFGQKIGSDIGIMNLSTEHYVYSVKQQKLPGQTLMWKFCHAYTPGLEFKGRVKS
jgi:hypothetical protein